MSRSDPGDDLERAIAFVERRYAITARERLEVIESGATPRFVLVRTRLGCSWRFRADLPAAPIRELAKLAGREGNVVEPFEAAAPPERAEPMLRVLHRAGIPVVAMRELLVCRGDGPIESWVWERRRELGASGASEAVCFADLISFVDDPNPQRDSHA
jgi:hypothetical protein